MGLGGKDAGQVPPVWRRLDQSRAVQASGTDAASCLCSAFSPQSATTPTTTKIQALQAHDPPSFGGQVSSSPPLYHVSPSPQGSDFI